MVSLSEPTPKRNSAHSPMTLAASPWVGMLGIAAVYFGAAKLGLTMAFVAEQVTAVWPPTGIALAVLLGFGSRYWPGIALGAFLANVATNAPIATVFGITVGNTLEALIGARLLRRFVTFDLPLERLKSVLGLVVLAAVVSTMVSATIGVTSLCLGGVEPWAAYGPLWWVWWLGDATGDLVMAPVLLTWARTRRSHWPAGRPVEAGALIISLVIMTTVVFSGFIAQDSTTHPLIYFIFPFIIWAALRFGQVGTTTVTFIASGITIWGTVHGLGPFAKGNVNESLILLQFFMAVVAVTGLLLGAAIAETRRAERRSAAQYATARILAESKTLENALTQLLEAVCRILDWDVGAVWTAGQTENELRLVQLWHAPSRQTPGFEAESRRRRFPPHIGLPGRVWATATPLWLANVIDDPNFSRLAVAAREGLHGAFGVPIIVGREARGVIAFFSREVRPPDDELLETMVALGHQVGQFIEQTRAEEACLASEARKAAILENALDCIITIDKDSQVIEWNPAAERTFGFSRAEAVGQSIAELIVPLHLREQYYRGIAQYFETAGGPVFGKRIETTCMRKGGSELLVELSIGVIHQGVRPFVTAYLRDITEPKRAETALRESEERFRQLADAMPQIVWTARPDGYVDYYNQRWYEYTGFPEGQGGDESWEPILHPDDVECCQERWYGAVRSGQAYQIEYRFRDKETGSYRWFLGRALPVRDHAGHIVRWFGTCTDIDDQKRAVAALAEATQAKDQFLALLSHELRTPLTPILVGVTAMLNNPRTCLHCQPTLAMVRDNVQLEARLIEDLLDLSRIARGEITYRFQRADVHDLIQRAVEICRTDLAAKGHRLAMELDAAEHYVRADPARLQQVLWNLLTNAVKYTPRGGRIAIRTRSAGPERLAVDVDDDGVGINPDHLPHLFNAFERGDGAAFSHTGGLGLGLTISRSIAEAHSGTLKGASQGRNRGATFTLELATITAPEGSVEPPPAPPAGTRRFLRVLLAEDNLPTAHVMADVLRQEGHEVALATGLRRALEFACDAFDVVISDIDLGDGSGLDLMRHVRSLGDTPGIALSGYATEDDVRQSLEAGFAVHLAKPVTFEMLRSAIHKITAVRK